MAQRARVICASAQLADGGPGVRFELDPAVHLAAVGFAVRHCGAVRAFVNRCPHAGTELDWNPGEFFDETGLYLMCSTHGALFEPGNGHCVAGPCRGASLQPLAVAERDGQVILVNDAPASRTASR
jgi:nitrite reductase/ring-hydroxylating ferredoxin subunit